MGFDLRPRNKIGTFSMGEMLITKQIKLKINILEINTIMVYSFLELTKENNNLKFHTKL